jgi:hypothetical protein
MGRSVSTVGRRVSALAATGIATKVVGLAADPVSAEAAVPCSFNALVYGGVGNADDGYLMQFNETSTNNGECQYAAQYAGSDSAHGETYETFVLLAGTPPYAPSDYSVIGSCQTNGFKCGFAGQFVPTTGEQLIGYAKASDNNGEFAVGPIGLTTTCADDSVSTTPCPKPSAGMYGSVNLNFNSFGSTNS